MGIARDDDIKIDVLRAHLLDGMWLTSITPEYTPKSEEKLITHLTITGMGFVDKVTDAAAVGEFGEALKGKGYFGDEVEVERIGKPSEFTLEFTMRVGLKEPLKF